MNTTIKERPILFSGPMVKAILAGRKTQTRRIMKQQPDTVVGDGERIYARWWNEKGNFPMTRSTVANFICPYGLVGDRLWVRETFATASNNPCISESPVVYRSTDPDWDSMEGFKWKPSIFMPRWASRVTLEITDVRVERLNDIGEQDAIAEGIQPSTNGAYWMDYIHGIANVCKPEYSFMTLWNSINGPGSWAANPWVWVIQFQKV